MRLWVRRLLFAVILLVYLIAGVCYIILTPPWQNPDEPAHFNYIRAIADQTIFPELTAGCYDQAYLSTLTGQKFPKELSIDSICYEFHQPPTYYILAAPVYWLSNGQILAIRTLSLLLGAGIVALTYFIGHIIFPGWPAIALGGMAFVAFVPMHVAILSSVNNDSLAGLCFATILLVLLRRLRIHQGQPTWINDVLLGVLLGAALVVKTSIYIAVPLAASTLIFQAVKWKQNLVLPAVTVFGLALLIALPWYARNAVLYGNFDILGLGRHDEVVVGQLRTAEFVSDVGLARYLSSLTITTFQSFWGQFGWMAVPMDGRTYRFLLLLVLVASFGFIVFVITRWRGNSVTRLTSQQWQMMGLLALSTLFTFLAYGWYNFSFVQFQGRYLFTAIIPLGIFSAIGLAEALAVRWRYWFLGGMVLAAVLVSWQGDTLDKWELLIVGLILTGAVLSVVFRRWASGISNIMLVSCYAGLAMLALASPVWYIIPYL